MNDVILRAEGITKAFFGNKVLDDAQIELRAGRVHALCGENGAGKSTLLKIITGLYSKDAGDIYMDGKLVNITNVNEAQSHGIYVVPQEVQVQPNLTVAENIFLGKLPTTKQGLVDWKKTYRIAEEVKARLGEAGAKLNVRAKTGGMSMGNWQLIEIMRALVADNLRVIAFDEPTSSLSDSEVELLFKLIDDLRSQGLAIVYVSHKLKEIFTICDDISILRDGKYIGSRVVKETTADDLISMMIGRDLNLYGAVKKRLISDEVALEAKNFTHGTVYQNVNLKVHKGEILGMYGLVGAGRTEFARGLFGLDQKNSGELIVGGKTVNIKRPSDAIEAGIGFVTENRRAEGLMLGHSLTWNITMTNLKAIVDRLGNIRKKKEYDYAQKGMQIFRVKAVGQHQPAATLSGGNQQKVVLAKWIMAECDVLIVDEPTRGIDVGAKAEVYQALSDLAAQGKAIIMISSELPEILGVSDRILVMCEGKITAELKNDNLKEEDVIHFAFAT